MIIVPVKEGENIEKALKKDGTRCLRTEAARYRRVKKYSKIW